MSVSYAEFIASKSRQIEASPIPHRGLAPHLFPFQRDLVAWALRRGRAALFADTGLGKTAMQLEWARHAAKLGRVLILTPLAVAQQTVKEGARFGVEAVYARRDGGDRITVTNYELLEHFDAESFSAVVLDESSILKSYDGATRNAIIGAFSRTPYRLACTATPAPNDFTELGNHAEFLGVKSRVEMLSEYFVHDGGSTQDWRIKGHAVVPFWRWVAAWGAVVKKPSDLGYDDGAFDLPPLVMREEVIETDDHDIAATGMLFAAEAKTLSDQRAIRRATQEKRAARAAELAGGSDPVLVWCELNAEADSVEARIPGSVQVKGSDSPEDKADRLIGFAEGRYRVLISKPSIAGFGLNYQHCARMVFMGASHSYEQTYQAIRRCWRFGQTRTVEVITIRADTEGAVVANYRRKEADAQRMAEEMTAHVGASVREEVRGAGRRWNEYAPSARIEIPEWLGEETA